MAETKERVEGWCAFMGGRFRPRYWMGGKPRLHTMMIGIFLGMLILAAQLYLGVIGQSGIHGRIW